MDAKLYKLLKKGMTSNIIFVYLAVVVFIFTIVSVIMSGQLEGVEDLLTLILTMGILAAILYYMYRDQFLGPAFWTKLIEKRPEELVWIKPVTTKHKLWYVVTVSESYSVELLTSKGVKTEFAGTKQQLQNLLEAVAVHAPHAHHGYSREVEKIYNKKKRRFAEVLKEEGLYNPLAAESNETLEK